MSLSQALSCLTLVIRKKRALEIDSIARVERPLLEHAVYTSQPELPVYCVTYS